jgi:hypothetical protein
VLLRRKDLGLTPPDSLILVGRPDYFASKPYTLVLFSLLVDAFLDILLSVGTPCSLEIYQLFGMVRARLVPFACSGV